jgi:hypothetical protein
MRNKKIEEIYNGLSIAMFLQGWLFIFFHSDQNGYLIVAIILFILSAVMNRLLRKQRWSNLDLLD